MSSNMKSRASKVGSKKAKPHCLKKSSRKKPAHSRASGHQICTEGFFAEDAVILDALNSLFARANGSSLESEIARVELRRVLWSFTDRLMNSAVDQGGSVDRAFAYWAGRMVAELLIVHEKSEDWFSAHSQAYKCRVSELRKRSHLLLKRANYSGEPSPLMIWLIRAHERFAEVVDLCFMLEEFDKCTGPKVSDRFSAKIKWFRGHPRKGFSEVESGALKVFCEIEKKPPQEQGDILFSKFIWPWLVGQKELIEGETWCAKRKQTSGGYHQRSSSFSNLKKDFRHLWKGYFARPAGDLRGLERAG